MALPRLPGPVRQSSGGGSELEPAGPNVREMYGLVYSINQSASMSVSRFSNQSTRHKLAAPSLTEVKCQKTRTAWKPEVIFRFRCCWSSGCEAVKFPVKNATPPHFFSNQHSQKINWYFDWMGFIRDHSGNKYTTRNKILKGKTQQKPSIDFLFFFSTEWGEKAQLWCSKCPKRDVYDTLICPVCVSVSLESLKCHSW